MISKAMLGACSAMIAIAANVAEAREQTEYNIDLPQQALARSLRAVAAQTDSNVVFAGSTVEGRTAPALKGRFTARSAYRTLLKGSSLMLRETSGGSFVVTAGAVAQASTANSPAAATERAPEYAPPQQEIVVTGSQIKGAKVDDVLPVTVLTEDDIETTGAITGDELFRSIPQIGATQFNDQNTVGSANAARGDVASINLRDLGTGNTLLLINGRRMVLNPGFQTELLVPVVSPNTNTIPPSAVRRVEVLRDGASPVYGADAVAGVIDTQLRGRLKGGFVNMRLDLANETSQYEYDISAGFGIDFNGGRSNLTVYGNYFHGNRVSASEQDFSSSDDLRPFFVGTPFENDTQLNNRSTGAPWGRFQASNRITRVGDDDFHIQPCSVLSPTDTSFLTLQNGLCADNSSTTIDTDIRYDSAPVSDLFSERDRYNIFALFSHEFDNGLEFYAEGSYYYSKLNRNIEQAQILGGVPIGVTTTAYYNPFGAPDPSNPNRITPRPAGIPATGSTIQIIGYRAIDAGPREVQVTGDSMRFLAGLRGEIGSWDFDTAVLYTEANTTDRATRISNTLFQAAINRTDASAYNPFNGGSFTQPNSIDGTPSNQATIDSFIVPVYRIGKTTLALADFKISRPDLFTLPGGDLGIAVGVEARRETFIDNRDERLDGTITFTNAVTGVVEQSDVLGTSPSPDTSGNREVFSAFAETFVPLISEDMNVPLVEKLELQLAGRFEHFTDVGSTIVPRVAAAWTPFNGLLFRGAWSLGFRAPNLVQVNDVGTTRNNSRDDYVRCQAEFEKGLIANVGACGNRSTTSLRSGTDQLEPEDTTSLNFGIVISPSFIPRLTLTADYWRIKQTGLVGTFGDQNQLALDLLLRKQGSSNPNVIRDAPDADTLALFAGTSLAANPAGNVTLVLDPYLNLDSRTSKGYDFGAYYDLPGTGIGDFRFRFNAARLKSFFQVPGEDGQLLLDAIANGDLPTEVSVDGIGELMEQDGRPKWRFSTSVNWSAGNWDVSWFGKYIGSFNDISVTQDQTGEFLRVKSWFTMNASVAYTVTNNTALNGLRLKFGVNNIQNKRPPIADESYGYFGAEHNGKRRVFYFEARKKF